MCTSLCGLLCQGLKMNVGINFLFILCHQNIIHPLHCAVISLKSLNLRQVTMKNVHHSWASVSWFDKTAQSEMKGITVMVNRPANTC